MWTIGIHTGRLYYLKNGFGKMSPEPVVSPTMRCNCPAGTLLTLHILLIESPLWVFLSGVKLVFSRGCEHFLNQLLTRPGSQTLLDWGSDRQSAHPADRITQFHFSASIFIFFFFFVKWRGLLHTSSPRQEQTPGNNQLAHFKNFEKVYYLCNSSGFQYFKKYHVCEKWHASKIYRFL